MKTKKYIKINFFITVFSALSTIGRIKIEV